MDWLNYHHLYYFWRIARSGGLSRAAEELKLTHSTLSAQLRSLEGAIGGALFERRGRRLVLTPLGEQTASYADEIFRLGREMLDAARGTSDARHLALRIGIGPELPKTVAYRLFRPALDDGRFRPLLVRQAVQSALIEELAAGRLHVVLSDLPAPEASAHRVFAHLLGSSGVLLYARRSIAKTLRKNFPRSLEGCPMLLPTQASSIRRQIDRWLVERKIGIRVEGEFDDAAVMRTVGLHGHGVFPVREALKAELDESDAVELVGKLQGVEERYYVLSTERRVRHPAVNAIIEHGRAGLGAGAKVSRGSSR